MIEVKVFDYEDDDYEYKNKFVDYSLNEVWQIIKNGCSARLEQNTRYEIRLKTKRTIYKAYAIQFFDVAMTGFFFLFVSTGERNQ